jgi:hypothetical protein
MQISYPHETKNNNKTPQKYKTARKLESHQVYYSTCSGTSFSEPGKDMPDSDSFRGAFGQ